MRQGQYAVVDERQPNELVNGRHEIAITYDSFVEAVSKTADYVQKNPQRRYVVVKAIASIGVEKGNRPIRVDCEEGSMEAEEMYDTQRTGNGYFVEPL